MPLPNLYSPIKNHGATYGATSRHPPFRTACHVASYNPFFWICFSSWVIYSLFPLVFPRYVRRDIFSLAPLTPLTVQAIVTMYEDLPYQQPLELHPVINFIM
jgi:hypothetical protein